MKDCKLVKVPIPIGLKLFVDQLPKSQEEIEYMPHVPYASAVGNLMYAMVYTRPKIFHAVGVLSRYMVTLGKEHWTIVKRVFKNLHGMTYFAIHIRVHGFIDSNWDGDINER